MPFEPRVFHGAAECGPPEHKLDAGADADLALPDELSALAIQLRGEADELVARYPAPASAPVRTSARRPRLIWGGIAAAALIGITIGWRSVASHTGRDTPSVDVAAGQSTGTERTENSRPSPAHAVDASELRKGQGIQEAAVSATAPPPLRDQVEMLRSQVDGFSKYIQKLQAELAARDAAQAESRRQIESLRAEIDKLHKQLESQQQKQP